MKNRSEWEGVSGKLLYVCASRLDMSVSAEEYNKAIDDAIEEAVSTREKEIAEEVEKKSFRGFAPYEQHYLIKKGDVLSILKH